MLILDIPQRSPKRFAYIEVPPYHRVHLSLAANSRVHACLLAGVSEPHLPELVISPFEFYRWDRVWRLSATLCDRPGLLQEVCDIVRWNDVNILAAESSTMEEQKLFYLETILEAEDEHRMEIVEWSILSHFSKDIKLMADGSPRFRAHRLHELWQAKKAYEQQRKVPVSFAPLVRELDVRLGPELRVQEPPTRPPRSGKFRLRLPPEIRDLLKAKMTQSTDHGKEGYYLRLSDTKDRFLRVLFFKINDPVVHCRIEYSQNANAASGITQALKAKGFNILTAYLGPSEGQHRSRMEVVTRCQSLSGRSTSEIKTHLEEALRQSSCSKDLQMTIGYPRNYSREWKKRTLDPIATIRPPLESNDSWVEQILLGLKAHQGTLCRSLLHSMDSSERSHRWVLVNRLIQQCERSFGVPIEQGKSLFISCHYKGRQLELMEKLAKDKGFRVFTGKDLLDDPTITAGLLTRMNCCSHFLGVWSSDGAHPCGPGYWPSPWLLWEFGVAEAFGLEWRLLISKNIIADAWQKIAAHRQHTFFDDFDFQTQARVVLSALAALPASRLPFLGIPRAADSSRVRNINMPLTRRDLP